MAIRLQARLKRRNATGAFRTPTKSASQLRRKNTPTRINKQKEMPPTMGKNARFLANRMSRRGVGSKTRVRNPSRSSPNALDMVGAMEKEATSTANVAAAAVRKGGGVFSGRVKRADTIATPIISGMINAIFNSGARSNERNVASARAEVWSGSHGKLRSTSSLPAGRLSVADEMARGGRPFSAPW